MPTRFRYLHLEEVLLLHELALQLYGGDPGLRDAQALDSALAQPRQSFGGKPLYRSLYQKAAAYAFYLCQNHPFLDGNKRTAALAMGIFLELNGRRLTCPQEELVAQMLKIARGQQDIPTITQWLEEHCSE